jgi:hypothetical protein
MGFQILPSSLGSLGAGSSINQLSGPLSSLFNNSAISNLVYPSDLASNPSMCHAVQFSIYDYTTGFEEAVNNTINQLQNTNSTEIVENLSAAYAKAGALTQGFLNTTSATPDLKTNAIAGGYYIKGLTESGINGGIEAANKILPSVVKAVQAPTYRPKRRTNLANISLYMPDSLVASHNSQYSEINFTDAIGIAGPILNAISETKNQKDIKNYFPTSPYGKALTATVAGALAGKVGGNANDLKQVAANALGIYTNPQVQLIYKGISLREFSLNFVFTPKSPQEAQTTKNIIDTFTYYSVPGLGSAAIDGQPGQYLTPPQLFTVKFVFLGQNGIGGSVANIFSSALNNLGLNSLLTTNPTNTITNASAAKIMTIQECVLESVNVDYAPNGWSAFNDGYPVQTTLSLTFKETQILTKDKVGNAAVAGNYADPHGRNAETAATFKTNIGSQQTAMLQQQNEGF